MCKSFTLGPASRPLAKPLWDGLTQKARAAASADLPGTGAVGDDSEKCAGSSAVRGEAASRALAGAGHTALLRLRGAVTRKELA